MMGKLENSIEVMATAIVSGSTENPVLTGAIVGGYFLKDAINEIVKNIGTPPSKEVGNLFGKIVNHSTFQSETSQDAAGKVMKAVFGVSEKLKDKNPDDFVDLIPPEISVPLFSKLTYFEDTDLRELLTSLLASSMLKEGQVHPSIVSLADRLTSGEAKILKKLSEENNKGPWPCISIKALRENNSKTISIPEIEILRKLSALEAKKLVKELELSRTGTYLDIGAQYISTISQEQNTENNDDIFFYTTNLRSLGIVEVTDGTLNNKNQYTNLIANSYKYIEQARSYEGNEPKVEFGKLSITTIGIETLKAFRKI